MPGLLQRYSFVTGLYWISFLLTGSQELSIGLITEALTAEEDLESLSHPAALARLRRAVIRSALAAMSDELARSKRRSDEEQKADEQFTPLPGWTFGLNPTVDQVRDALLEIDVFPRGALLLTVFEGFSLREAAILLKSDEESTSQARIKSLLELTRSLRCAELTLNETAQAIGVSP